MLPLFFSFMIAVGKRIFLRERGIVKKYRFLETLFIHSVLLPTLI